MVEHQKLHITNFHAPPPLQHSAATRRLVDLDGGRLIFNIDMNPLRRGTASADPACSRVNPASTRRQSLELAALALASLALLGFLPYADRHQILVFRAPTLRWLGLTLCCLGGVVRVVALRSLGPQFSAYVTLQPGHQLVRSGIYSLVRHPLYLSLLLAGPGLALVFASQLVMPIALLSALFIASRIRAEDALLAQTFPHEFHAYRACTAMLVPFVL
jgi:protein-S-isoprenylcysteine O-methyltransferase Ste14